LKVFYTALYKKKQKTYYIYSNSMHPRITISAYHVHVAVNSCGPVQCESSQPPETTRHTNSKLFTQWASKRHTTMNSIGTHSFGIEGMPDPLKAHPIFQGHSKSLELTRINGVSMTSYYWSIVAMSRSHTIF